jgi:hypothetical protein
MYIIAYNHLLENPFAFSLQVYSSLEDAVKMYYNWIISDRSNRETGDFTVWSFMNSKTGYRLYFAQPVTSTETIKSTYKNPVHIVMSDDIEAIIDELGLRSNP